MSRPVRIVFIVMSAVARPQTVDQLASALAPHTVLVHHDFSQSPNFRLQSPNVRFVPDPRRTGWAVFGFSEGVFHSMRHALQELDFDYLQLLSPTCLPIKPLAQFERHVAGAAEAHFDCIDVLRDEDALMSVGYRAFTPEGTLRHRALRRLVRLWFGESPGRRDEAGVWLRSGRASGLLPLVARTAIGAFSQPWIGRHPFGPSFRPYYGSPWLGARRHVVEGLVERFERPGIREHFSRLRIADEFLMVSLLSTLVERKGPLNHFIRRYDQAHVTEFQPEDFAQLRDSRAWFARKFPDDPAAAIRVRVLEELVGLQAEPPADDAWPIRAYA
jgi:hypothetical protein